MPGERASDTAVPGVYGDDDDEKEGVRSGPYSSLRLLLLTPLPVLKLPLLILLYGTLASSGRRSVAVADGLGISVSDGAAMRMYMVTRCCWLEEYNPPSLAASVLTLNECS